MTDRKELLKADWERLRREFEGLRDRRPIVGIKCPTCHLNYGFPYAETVVEGQEDPGYYNCHNCSTFWIPRAE